MGCAEGPTDGQAIDDFKFADLTIDDELTAGCRAEGLVQVDVVPPEIKTVSIQYFFDEVGAGPPTLGQSFTEDLKDYFQQNTSLAIVEYDGDIQLEGSIVGYNFSPLAPRASGNQNFNNADVAGLERLKITVNVSYVNTYDESKNFDRRFSFYRDYDPQSNPLSQNEIPLLLYASSCRIW